MKKIKCITFDKEAQNTLPNHIKQKMRADRLNAQKNFKLQGELQLKELLKKAFTAGSGAFESFDEWYKSL